MSVENVPESYIKEGKLNKDLFVYDFKMAKDVVKSKINLSMNMFSFLQIGKKQVHFSDASVVVNKEQSLLIKKGNCLWTELLDVEDSYYCKLLFFSENKLINFLKKHTNGVEANTEEIPFFVIENDTYILSYLNSLTTISEAPSVFLENLLSVKFEELLLYLINKYGRKFELYLYSLITKEVSSFNKVIESNAYSNLKLEEIAFLCNMSLSTFKRHFLKEYNTTPGKWLLNKRLQEAKNRLIIDKLKPSEIYLDLGYNNLSNFSIAFKNKFGISPKDIVKYK